MIQYSKAKGVITSAGIGIRFGNHKNWPTSVCEGFSNHAQSVAYTYFTAIWMSFTVSASNMIWKNALAWIRSNGKKTIAFSLLECRASRNQMELNYILYWNRTGGDETTSEYLRFNFCVRHRPQDSVSACFCDPIVGLVGEHCGVNHSGVNAIQMWIHC